MERNKFETTDVSKGRSEIFNDKKNSAIYATTIQQLFIQEMLQRKKAIPVYWDKFSF